MHCMDQGILCQAPVTQAKSWPLVYFSTENPQKQTLFPCQEKWIVQKAPFRPFTCYHFCDCSITTLDRIILALTQSVSPSTLSMLVNIYIYNGRHCISTGSCVTSAAGQRRYSTLITASNGCRCTEYWLRTASTLVLRVWACWLAISVFCVIDVSLLLSIGNTVPNPRHRRTAGVPEPRLTKFRQCPHSKDPSMPGIAHRCSNPLWCDNGVLTASRQDHPARHLVHLLLGIALPSWQYAVPRWTLLQIDFVPVMFFFFPAHSKDFLVVRKLVEKCVCAEFHIDALKKYLNASIIPRDLRFKLRPATSELCSVI